MARRDEKYILYTFESPHMAIKSQKVLGDFKTKIIPVLREISESCGMALKVQTEDMELSMETLKASDIQKWKAYRVEIEDGNLSLELIEEKGNI